MKPNSLSSLWRFVVVKGPNDCWLWTAGVNLGGYGKARVASESSRTAHVLIYTLVKGRPTGMILHSCNNKLCCNPNHLVEGTNSENQWHHSLTSRSVSSSSKIKGVSYNRKRKHYQVTIDQGKSFLYRGPDKQKALEARLAWEEKVKLQLKNRNILKENSNDHI